MSDILITANNISKIYDQDILLKRGANFYALRNVDFILEEGDFISVMGPSGSGKSTLLNCLSTLDEVSSGAVKIFNRFVGEMNDAELSDYRNRYLGFIFQNHNLVPSLSVFDNIATPLILNEVSPQEIKERVNEIGERLNISHTLYKKPNECSGGERQRVAIARAIVTKPKIVVCDEPTGNLDSKNSHEVLEILRELNQQGTSIILVTHDISEAIAMGDKVAVLSKRPSTIKNEYKIDLSMEEEKTPFKCRKVPKFQTYFDLLWKELDNNEL